MSNTPFLVFYKLRMLEEMSNFTGCFEDLENHWIMRNNRWLILIFLAVALEMLQTAPVRAQVSFVVRRCPEVQ